MKKGLMQMLTAALAAVALVCLVGCQEEPVTKDNASVKGGGENPVIANEPGQKIPAEGIQLQPKDPNDPRFKQDPKLGGGG
jgi:hypothetical protein